jgi:hypothetical protein
LDTMNPGDILSDVDRFLDWRVDGLVAVRDVLERPFDWSTDLPQTEYESSGDIPREIRSSWHPVSNQFYLYWRAKRDAVGGVLDRADIDPFSDIPLLCPHICMFEPSDRGGDRLDWFCRVMGTHVDQVLGFTLTGRFVSEVYSDPSLDQIRRYSLVTQDQLVSHRSGPSRSPMEERVGRVESLYVPLTDRRRKTRVAFGVAVYQWLPF